LSTQSSSSSNSSSSSVASAAHSSSSVPQSGRTTMTASVVTEKLILAEKNSQSTASWQDLLQPTVRREEEKRREEKRREEKRREEKRREEKRREGKRREKETEREIGTVIETDDLSPTKTSQDTARSSSSTSPQPSAPENLLSIPITDVMAIIEKRSSEVCAVFEADPERKRLWEKSLFAVPASARSTTRGEGEEKKRESQRTSSGGSASSRIQEVFSFSLTHLCLFCLSFIAYSSSSFSPSVFFLSLTSLSLLSRLLEKGPNQL
jgi:hypothetical protein